MGDGAQTTRRSVLRTAGAAVVGGAGALAVGAHAAQAAPGPGEQVIDQLKLVDDKGQQRFLAQTSKPPLLVDGLDLPPADRGGPDDATYLIFNDENQSEKGGFTVSSTSASMGLDYPNVQAITLETNFSGSIGAAALGMRQMPDPSLSPIEVTAADAPMRVLLGTDNGGDGALLFLNDSKGRTRIALQVDADDVPTIRIFDADGNVVTQLPPGPPAAAGPARASRGLLRPGSLIRRLRGAS